MSSTPHAHIFLSTVTAEFQSYRDELARHLDRPNVSVKVQENFIATCNEKLDKLDDYIQSCDVVIHLVGQAPRGGGRCERPPGEDARRPLSFP